MMNDEMSSTPSTVDAIDASIAFVAGTGNTPAPSMAMTTTMATTGDGARSLEPDLSERRNILLTPTTEFRYAEEANPAVPLDCASPVSIQSNDVRYPG